VYVGGGWLVCDIRVCPLALKELSRWVWGETTAGVSGLDVAGVESRIGARAYGYETDVRVVDIRV